MLNTIRRFASSGTINITGTVENTVAVQRRGQTFHVENIAFELELQGITIANAASTKTDDTIIGQNQIRNRLNEMCKPERLGWLKKLGGGWYVRP